MKTQKNFRLVFVLSLFFLTKAMGAQVQPSEAQSAMNLGSVIEITSSDPLWTTMWQVASESETGAHRAFSLTTEPVEHMTCKNGVCCQTVNYYSFDCACWRFVTTCWEEASGRILAKISM